MRTLCDGKKHGVGLKNENYALTLTLLEFVIFIPWFDLHRETEHWDYNDKELIFLYQSIHLRYFLPS